MRTLKLCWIAFCGCASSAPGSMERADAGVSMCTIDSDCHSGQTCRGGFCGTAEDDGDTMPDAGTSPRILASPTEVDFGAPLVGSEVIDHVTVANIGEGALRVTRVIVEENDELDEFIANPSGELDWALEPGGSMEIEVSLRFQDLEEDHGVLVIESNDPETNALRIPLTSELKGDPAVAVCIHEPGWDDPFADCALDEEVRFSVLFGESATLYVTLWNAGSDNRPLEVAAIDTEEPGSFFDLTVTDAVGDAVGFPALLTAEQADRATDYLVIRVDFTGTQNTYVGGVPDEIVDAIMIDSNDEDQPRYDVPLRARVVCAEDCDGLLCDDCCTPTGPERCDGEDNDCNGEMDEDPFTVLCTAPPSSGCLDDGRTYRSYGPLGLCLDGECDYTGSMVDVLCDDSNPCTTDTCPDATCVYVPIACDDDDPCTIADRCDDGECVADPRTCDTPPDAVCVGTSIRIFDGGSCVGGDCEYAFEDTPCPAPENATATCVSATCGFECEEGYEECGEECCLIPWIPTAVEGAPSARTDHVAFWTGSEMIVWGGYDGSPETWGFPSTGGRYDPDSDTWRPTSTDVTLLGNYGHIYSVVWTDSEMIVWGGTDASGPVSLGTNTGARYNPTTDTWTSVSTETAPASRQAHTSVWTGSEMIIWGGYEYHPETISYEFFSGGGRYDPATDTWILFEVEGAPEGRVENSAAWTGEEMLVWGGYSDIEGSGVRVNTGGRYNPITNSWSAISVIDAPSIRRLYTFIWTGLEMIVWGGCANERCDAHLNSGARYNPTTDAWIPTTVAADVPTARREHTAIWTGSEMIVWGGSDGVSRFTTGGHYDPEADSWWPTTPFSVEWNLREHTRHTAIWTGSEMIVWGGGHSAGPTNTGGRYRP